MENLIKYINYLHQIIRKWFENVYSGYEMGFKCSKSKLELFIFRYYRYIIRDNPSAIDKNSPDE
jgi:hypothetical protein